MQMILFRHGIAMDQDEAEAAGISETERPLTSEGITRTDEAVKGLLRIVERVDLVVCSPLARAQKTAEILGRHYPAAKLAQTRWLSPGTAPDKLFSFLLQRLVKDVKEETVVLVGHEPDLSSLAAWALTGRRTGLFSLRKAGACLIEFKGPPSAGKGSLGWLLTAGQLRRLA
jgi:phosphohistidine phosphatase